MKNFKMLKLASYLFTMIFFFNIELLFAQAVLSPDQNPNYRRSRAKYMQSNDTLISFHEGINQNKLNTK